MIPLDVAGLDAQRLQLAKHQTAIAGCARVDQRDTVTNDGEHLTAQAP